MCVCQLLPLCIVIACRQVVVLFMKRFERVVLGRRERTLNSAPIVDRITIANTDMTILVCLLAPNPLQFSGTITHHDHAFMADTTGFTMVGGCSASGIARRRVYGGASSVGDRRQMRVGLLVERFVARRR
jgi:hypothetical protein